MPRERVLFYCSLVPFFVFSTLFVGVSHAQNFPNPASLSTGQGLPGANDPIWDVSTVWYPVGSPAPNPSALTYTDARITASGTCATSWVVPANLPAPVNNGNWIVHPSYPCNNNSQAGYLYYRLELNLPADCNGVSVTNPGVYTLSFDGYVDNTITRVFINNVDQGITPGGGFTFVPAPAVPYNFTLNGPWQVGQNYIYVEVLNSPGGSSNPYGLLLVATATSPADTDGDGVPNIDDHCPCDPGTNPFGCPDPPSLYNCDRDAIRTAFSAAGCLEMPSCSDACSMYFLNPQSMTGSQAQNFAQTLGANLVSIQSAAENACLLTSLNTMNQTGVIWIGFSDEVVEGTFVWYDQSPVTYTNWAPGEPNQSGNEDCVQIYPGGANPGTWNDLSCSSNNSKSIIEVNLCPVINAGNDVSICIGATANIQASNTLFGSAPYTYSWDNGVSAQANPITPATISTTSHVVTTVDRYSCTTSDTVNVTVNPLPVVSAGPDVQVCPLDQVTLSGSGASTYTWTTPVQNGVPFLPPTSTQTYVVTGTDINGCQGRDTVTVSVVYSGCPNFPNTALCDIDSIRSAFTNAGCVEMTTCIDDCSLYFLNPQQMTGSQAQAFAQTLGANLVSVQSQAENQCLLSSLNSLGYGTGDVVWIGFNDEAVEGQFVWYDQAPVTYTNWASGEPNNQGGNEDCVQIYPGGSNPGMWNDLPCNSANSKSIIEVNLCPVVSIGPDVAICQDEVITFTATNALFGSQPYTYEWNTGTPGQTIIVTASATDEYSITVTDRYSCTAADTVLLTVNNRPVTDFGADTVCLDEVTFFNNYTNIGGTQSVAQWIWDLGDGNTSSQEEPEHEYLQDGIYNVTLVAVSGEGCADTLSKNVVVKYRPAVPVITDNSPVACVTDTFLLSINPEALATYFWEGPANFVSSDTALSIIAYASTEGIYKVYAEIDGCRSATAETELEITGATTPSSDNFPNIITVNGDGVNDTWNIDEYFTHCFTYTLKIWNRWGNLVFEQAFGESQFEGKSKFGTKLTPGVYFYIISYGDVEKTGTLTIVY